MPKQIDPLRKLKYKQSRLNNNSIAQSLRNAGYTNATASQSSSNSIVKHCEPELQAMVKASDITIEWVINQLTNELTAKDCKASDRIRVKELLGKYLRMFESTQNVQLTVFQPYITELDKRITQVTQPKEVTHTEPVNNLLDNVSDVNTHGTKG